jgi:hypothetical protein
MATLTINSIRCNKAETGTDKLKVEVNGTQVFGIHEISSGETVDPDINVTFSGTATVELKYKTGQFDPPERGIGGFDVHEEEAADGDKQRSAGHDEYMDFEGTHPSAWYDVFYRVS